MQQSEISAEWYIPEAVDDTVVLVENILESMDQDYLEDMFVNEAMTGGGEIEHIELMGSKATIKFKSSEGKNNKYIFFKFLFFFYLGLNCPPESSSVNALGTDLIGWILYLSFVVNVTCTHIIINMMAIDINILNLKKLNMAGFSPQILVAIKYLNCQHFLLE